MFYLKISVIFALLYGNYNTMESEIKNWSSEMLVIFGMWLWNNKRYGHGLLCIHGPIWGYKIGRQLKISWDDFYDSTGSFNNVLELPYSDEHQRPVNGLALKYLMSAKEMHLGPVTDRVYLNNNTGKPLTTSTLNRELGVLSAQFIGELIRKYGISLKLKPLKSNAFEIAWALKNVERYNYSKKSFIAVSKFMGHRSLKTTIELLGVEPLDNITFDFNGSTYNELFDSSVLENETLLKQYFG